MEGWGVENFLMEAYFYLRTLAHKHTQVWLHILFHFIPAAPTISDAGLQRLLLKSHERVGDILCNHGLH